MSSRYTSTSSASSSVTTTSVQSTPPTDNRLTIVGIVLGIIGLLCVAGVIYATSRIKRSSRSLFNDSESFTSSFQEGGLDPNHPATQVTPFGSVGGEAPRFKHIPGSDMRIATRRPNGAWQFSDPRDPFTPSGISEIDVIPSPSSTKGRFPSRAQVRETYSKSSWNLRFDYDHHDQSKINPPPPVYGYT